MDRGTYLKNFWMISLLVALLYFAAVNFGLFYIFDWYDTMMHLVGGMAIGYLGLYAAGQNASRFAPLQTAVLLAFTIGILWEVFERVGNYFVPTLLAYGGPRDTAMDVACAIIGAVIIVLINRHPGKRDGRERLSGIS